MAGQSVISKQVYDLSDLIALQLVMQDTADNYWQHNYCDADNLPSASIW